jgi:hypothetical protein
MQDLYPDHQVDTELSDGNNNVLKEIHPPPALKRKQSKPPANQVMTQIELPSYHGP